MSYFLSEDAAALTVTENITEDEFDNVNQVLALLHRGGGRHEVHHPEAVPEPQADRIGRPRNRLVSEVTNCAPQFSSPSLI